MANLLVHLFLPHHTNNHRAKVLHIDALLVYLIAFVLFQLVTSWGQASYPDILGYATDIRVEELLRLTNAKRAEAGLNPLSLNEKLSQAAAGKAQDMFSKNYWAHTSPDGKLPWDYITGSGYRYSVAGENLAKNFGNSGSVVDAWMASQSHKDNLLKPGYRDIGFAIVNGTLNGEETTLVVQMFGASSAPAVAQAAPAPVIREVVAQEPTPTQSGPTPIVIPEQAIAQKESLPLTMGFIESVRSPIINLEAVNRNVTYIFLGFLFSILALDWFLVHKRKIVRVSGRSHAHILFLAVFMAFISHSVTGSIL